MGDSPSLVVDRDVANNKFRIQIAGNNFGGKVLQLGRDDKNHDIALMGDVGIGTTGPDEPLHVHKGSAGTVNANAGSVAVLENSSTAYLSFLTPAANARGILYNSSGTPDGLQFRVNGNSTEVVIDGDGNDAIRTTWEKNDDVGLGTTAPAARLHVNGNFRVDGNVTIPATTRYLMIAGVSFAPSSAFPSDFHRSDLSFFNHVHLGQPGTGGTSVSLPHGAVVTQMSVWMLDNSVSTDMDVEMRLFEFGDTDVTVPFNSMAKITSAGSGGSQVKTDNSISVATVDNINHIYVIEATFPSGTAPFELFLRAVRIQYEVTAPLP